MAAAAVHQCWKSAKEKLFLGLVADIWGADVLAGCSRKIG